MSVSISGNGHEGRIVEKFPTKSNIPGLNFVLQWKVMNQNVNERKTKIHWTAHLEISRNVETIATAVGTISEMSIAFNADREMFYTIPFDIERGSSSSKPFKKILCDGYANIIHDEKGNAGFTLSVEVYARGAYFSNLDYSATETRILSYKDSFPRIRLPQLPLGSTLTVQNVTYDDTKATIKFALKSISSNAKHTVAIVKGSKTCRLINVNPSTAASQTLTIECDYTYLGNNSSSQTFNLVCKTYQNNTTNLLGLQTSVPVSIHMPETIVPSISSEQITMTPYGYGQNIYEKFQEYIDQMNVDIKVVGCKPTPGASIESIYYTLYMGSEPVFQYNATSTDNFMMETYPLRGVSGEFYIEATVIDSRGRRTTAKSKQYIVYTLTPPLIKNFSVIRADFTRPQEGILLDTGNSIRIHLDINISPINNKNNKSYTIEYAKSTNGNLAVEEEWVKLVDIPPLTSYDSSFTIDVDSSKADSAGKVHMFDQKNQYKFRVSATDYFETVKAETTVESEYVLLDFHASGTGIALGKIADKENTLDIDMNMILGGFNMNISSATVSLYESLGMQVFPEEIPMAEEYPTTFELLEKKEKK